MAGKPSKPGSMFINIADIALYIQRSWFVANNLTKTESFPKPIKIGQRRYWSKEEVINFLSKR